MVLQVIELARQLIGIDTRASGHEAQALDFLEPILREHGFEVVRHYSGPDGGNLLAILQGRERGPALAFTGHVDTVPLGDTPWTRDPFGGEIVDGRLYGRGSSDMKCGIAAFIAAAANARHEETLARDVVLVLTTGEERGCLGANAMKRDGFALPAIGAWVVAEPTANRMALGHKGALFMSLEVHGATAHSSMPEQGDNAIYRAAEAVLSVRDMALDHEKHPVLGGPTRNVGLIEGGHAANAVPDRAIFTMDIRSVPGMRHDRVKAAVCACVGERFAVKVLSDIPSVWTSEDAAFVDLCRATLVAHNVQNVEPIGMPFFTDASILSEMAPAPVVIIGPGEPTQAHKTDEWCDVAEIVRSTEIFQTLIANFGQHGSGAR